MNGDFAWVTVTSAILPHHYTVVAGRHAVRDPTNQHESVPLSASTLSTLAGPVTHRTEEVARMTQLSSAGMSIAGMSWPGMSWHCAGCNEERLFEQFHAEPETCPDVPDGDCQEWACAVCGDAVIIGLPAPAYDHSGSAARAA
jgi:hypothetical protein